MQQTKSYWRLVAVAGVVSAFVASACVVTTSTDDDTAGAGGASTAGNGGSGGSTAGSATAGSGTAGSQAGTGGSTPAGGAGPVPFQCDPGEGGAVGTPNSCAPSGAGNDCEKCIQAKCCGEYEACYATNPGNQCGWGGPDKVDGVKNEAGEIFCVQSCLIKVVEASGTAPEDSEVRTCAAECATNPSNQSSKDCGPVVGQQTSDLVACLRQDCSVACFGG
jgi:hypothetical protein